MESEAAQDAIFAAFDHTGGAAARLAKGAVLPARRAPGWASPALSLRGGRAAAPCGVARGAHARRVRRRLTYAAPGLKTLDPQIRAILLPTRPRRVSEAGAAVSSDDLSSDGDDAPPSLLLGRKGSAEQLRDGARSQRKKSLFAGRRDSTAASSRKSHACTRTPSGASTPIGGRRRAPCTSAGGTPRTGETGRRGATARRGRTPGRAPARRHDASGRMVKKSTVTVLSLPKVFHRAGIAYVATTGAT